VSETPADMRSAPGKCTSSQRARVNPEKGLSYIFHMY